MEILFENRSVRTPEMHKQLLQYQYFKRPFPIIVAILFSTSFLINLLSMVFWGDECNITVLIVVPLYFLYVFMLYRRTLNLRVKRDREQFGDTPPEFRTVVFPHQFQCIIQNTIEPITVPFSSIKKAFTTKDLIVLQSEAKLLYIFHKDGFTQGSAEEFIAFLKTLGIKCR